MADVNLAQLDQRVRTLEQALLTGLQANTDVYDTNGILRVEVGKLPARGISAAGYKIRANDSTGTPVFDSDGLIAVMKVLGRSALGAAIYSVNPSTISTITFSVARATSLLTWVYGNCSAPTGSPFGTIDLQLDGVGTWADAVKIDSTTGAEYPFSMFRLDSVSAGSHTITTVAQPIAAGSLQTNGGLTAVFQLGG